MLKVGITGGIGSGKSTASKYFAKLGAFIFDADTEAKNLIETKETVQNELIEEFGTDIITPQGKIDKSKLARVAFQNEDHQQRLNFVIHPYIFDLIDREFTRVSASSKYKIFLVDGAMIYESGFDAHLDYIVVVTALLMHRMNRALKRGNLSREDVLKRMDFQLPEEEKVNLADFVIHNDGSESTLKKNIAKIFKKLV
ncbi:MAG: dephospho-CoA kinase [Candidatus Neomarinimicrobiota bacterium]